MFFFTAKISNALSWSISRDTKSFFTLLTCGFKPCIIRINFPTKILSQLQECAARLVKVTNQPVPRPSTTSFAFSQAKLFSIYQVQNIDGYLSD